MPVREAAKALGIHWETAVGALHFARTGRLAHSKILGWMAETPKRDRTPAVVRIAEEVRRLCDEDHLPFAEIARLVHSSTFTVARAYDRRRPDLIDAPGRRHGIIPRLAVETRREVLRQLDAGEHPQQVARAAGCSERSVYRIKQAARRDHPDCRDAT